MIYISENLEVKKFPYQHTFSEYEISGELHDLIIDWLEKEAPWKLSIKSFYTQYELSLFDVNLPKSLIFLTSPEYLSYLKKIIETNYKVNLLNKFDVVGHKLVKGHSIKIHNDYLQDQDPRESYRLLFHFNKSWNVDNGGLCILFSSYDANEISDVIVPEGKLAHSFKITQNSYHAVSKVFKGNRLSLIFTFYEKNNL